MNAKQRTTLSVLIVVSMTMCLFAAALQAGYEHPIQNSDSGGNLLGFCNALTWELTGILLRSASLATVMQTLGTYGWLYLSLHLAALFLLATNSAMLAERRMAIGFWGQLVLFPLSWLGLLAWPGLISSFLKGQIDGETISDMPFWWVFQPIWFFISVGAGIFIWRSTRRLRPDPKVVFSKSASC